MLHISVGPADGTVFGFDGASNVFCQFHLVRTLTIGHRLLEKRPGLGAMVGEQQEVVAGAGLGRGRLAGDAAGGRALGFAGVLAGTATGLPERAHGQGRVRGQLVLSATRKPGCCHGTRGCWNGARPGARSFT